MKFTKAQKARFAENIRSARAEANMTQRALSERTGLSENTIARYEIGDRCPSQETLKEIAKATGKPVAWFLRKQKAVDLPVVARHRDGYMRKYGSAIGDKILMVRSMKRMTQVEFAELVGLAPPSVSQYETGRKNPSRATIEKIADATGFDVAWFYQEE